MIYEKGVRTNAVRLATQIGIKAAAEQLDIPYNTLLRWHKADNPQSEQPLQVINSPEQEEVEAQAEHIPDQVPPMSEPPIPKAKPALTAEELKIRVLESEISRLKEANVILAEALDLLLARLQHD